MGHCNQVGLACSVSTIVLTLRALLVHLRAEVHQPRFDLLQLPPAVCLLVLRRLPSRLQLSLTRL